MPLTPLSLALAACHDDRVADVTIEACTDCALTDDNQYSYVADLDAEVTPLAAGADATIRWSDLTRDIHGHPRDPRNDIDSARLIAFEGLSPAQVLEGFASDTLPQSAITLFLSCTPRDASCALSDFGMMGNTLDIPTYFVPGVATWLVALTSPLEAGVSAFAFVEPVDDGGGSEAGIDDSTSGIEVEVDFVDLDAVVVEAAKPELRLDWSEVTVDGLGNPLAASSMDNLLIGRFDADRAELAQRVFDLELDADESWELALDGATNADLSGLLGDTPFPGIDEDSTWLVALRCSTCLNPAPRVVSFLEAR